MGGRGASSGISVKGVPYGKGYSTVRINGKPLKVSNIKFIKQTKEGSVTAPMETMTKGRVYAVIDGADRVNSIVYFDNNLKRKKSINLLHNHKNIKGPHTHLGYFHDENGTRRPTIKEKRMIEFVTRTWYNRNSKL